MVCGNLELTCRTAALWGSMNSWLGVALRASRCSGCYPKGCAVSRLPSHAPRGASRRQRYLGWRRRVAHPCAALRLRRWEAPIDDHDGDPLRPRLPTLLRDAVSQSALKVRCSSIETQDPCRPRLTHIFPPPVRLGLQHRDPLPPECRLPRQRLPLLLPSRIGIVACGQVPGAA